jgi:hypothetical protein
MISFLRFSVYILELTCFAKSCPRDHNLIDSSAKLGQSSDTAAMDQVHIAYSSHILEHSPDDEIEGEIVYLQSNLLKDVVAVKQRYGKGRRFCYVHFYLLCRNTEQCWLLFYFIIACCFSHHSVNEFLS